LEVNQWEMKYWEVSKINPLEPSYIYDAHSQNYQVKDALRF